ncbi:non-ribosomal peptide synthase/polyketide synthase [Nocardia sp. CWNU-33]|uniref:non-ribosomal peptide synthase/polyketide synthase n=1 Tax=Nocardia sp. CWNU-33 TaxID=3392117 RepID=UPI00398EC56D
MHGTELGEFGARPDETAHTGAVPPAPTPFPLAPAQLGVWYAQLIDPDVPINIAQYVDVHGELDIAILQEESIEAAYECQSILVRLGESDGVPYQCVDPELSKDIKVIDLRTHADPIAAAQDWMRTDMSAPVDLIADRLAECAVLRVADQRYFWYLRAHHLVFDGYGALTSTNRVAERYTARVLGTELAAAPPGKLAALVEGELAYRNSTRYATDRAHWAQRVAGLDSATSLDGRTAPRAAMNLIAGRALPERLVEQMNVLASSQDSTFAVVLLAAFACYLGRLTDRDEVVLSLPVTARTTAVMRRSAGMLSNIVPLRLPVGGARSGAPVTWGALLRATRVEVAGALRHQRYRHEDIRRDAEHDGQPARRALFGPLANIMLFGNDLTLGDTVARYHVLSTGPVEDLSFNVYYGERDSVHVDFEANPNLYGADEIARHHARFLQYLERLLATDLDAPVDAVRVATELELEVSTRIWNATGYDVDAVLPGRSAGRAPVATLVSLFEAQVARTPDAVAVRYADGSGQAMTYREVAARSNRLARQLIGLGVGPETVVALNLRRSPELLVAIYAVLAAGAAYVPLDPDHPAERTAHILATARPACVLTTERDGAPAVSGVPVVYVDRSDPGCCDGPVWDRERTAALRPGHPAYVIFTSGSTGLPKGVAVTHEAIVNRLVWMQSMYRLGVDDVVLQKTPATFDVSVWEFFWPLQVGATLVLAQHDGHRDPAYLRAVIAEYGVTAAHFVPSMLEAFLAHHEFTTRTTLRMVFASGEALPAAPAQRLRVLTGARLHNLYGPTEAAVDVTFHEVTDADTLSVPIGGPVFNTRLYVLDSRLRPVPVGAPGELYLSGVQLARGYLDRPGLSAGRFVADPFGGPDGPSAPGDRMYRTGDLVRWTTAGELEYLGRTDFQVKLRGLRIELGEIESVLGTVDSVVRAVVVVRDDAGVGEQLVAYAVESEPGSVLPRQLRTAAIRALPGYMVPAAFVVLDALPVNASGKLDRAALPAPERTTTEYVAAVTSVEQTIARVFGEVLGHERVGRNDDFFALGGNSLVATQVAARLAADLGCRLGVRELFTATTVSELAELIERAGGIGGVPAVALLRARPRPPLVPLSPAQQRIWFLNRFDSSGVGYNMPFVARLRGAVDVAALRSALDDVLARHEVLRTIFPAMLADAAEAAEGVAAQQVVLPMAEALGVAEPIGARELDAELLRFAARGFDLEHEIPFRARVFTVDDGSHAVVLVLHHIAADGLSLRVLARDVMTAYGARRVGAEPGWSPLSVQYADYSLWQRARGLPAGHLEFWTATLAGAPDQLELPTDRPRPPVSSGAGAVFGFVLPQDLHVDITDLARAEGVSTFMVVHGALAVLLSRLSGTADIVIGTPIAGRGERALDDLIGMFVNTLVLRTEVDAAASFAALLARVREVDLAAFGHAELPFEQLVEAINPTRSQARHPMFQVMLAFDNAQEITLELPDMSVATSTLDTGVTKFDLQLTVTEGFVGAGLEEGSAPTGVRAEFTYATDLFDEATIADYARWLVLLLRAITADADLPVGDLPLLDAAGQRRAIERGRAPRATPATGTVLAAFEEQVRRTPDAVALLDGDRTFTYAELSSRVNRLARVLIDAGVEPESLVVLGMRRSAELVVGAYAVLTAGGAYVPIDPDQPVARIAHVIASAQSVCVLTTSADGWQGGSDVPVIAIDALDGARYSDAPVGDAERPRPLRALNTAYVIFTSGSTGRPKGVAVQHASMVNQVEWIADEYRIGRDDVVLFKTPATFDVSVWELFAPLARGARIVVAEHDGHRDSGYLAALIAAHSVTMTSFVPSMLTVFADAAPGAAIASLRTVFVAGEAMTGEAAADFAAASSAQLHNLYGPTEFTVHATHAPVDAASSGPVPIGRPVRASQVLVLDARLRPVPETVVGELYLSGVQVARGYHGRADLSAERFVANPYGPQGSRMYRTGDLVRRTRAGALEYLGRSDFQVKLRGQRIELGEIEAALVAASDVRAAAVRIFAHPAGDMLVAYVVTAIPEAELAAVLGQRLRAALPSYMVPAAYVGLEAMPLTSSGKLDRTALPDPVPAANVFRAPATIAEQAVAEAFGKVLGLDRVGLDDDFFALGGNSLVATQIAARIGAAVGTDVPVRMLFEHPTVGAFAANLPAAGGATNRRPLVARPRPDRVPLSYAQQRMWFLNQFDANSVANNLTAAVRLTGVLDRAALSAAIGDVLARHETLRTSYPAVDGIARQHVLPIDETPTRLIAEPVEDADLQDRIRAIAALPFAVDKAAPVRLTLLETGARNDTAEGAEQVLVVSIHHIAADGWSIAPLTRDIMLAYAARCAGTTPAWTPLPVQYADFTLWQRETLGAEADPDSLIAEQIRYWSTELAGLPDTSTLPADRPRPAVASGRGDRHTFTIDAALHRRLRELADESHASLFMVVHAAFATLLAKLAGQQDVSIGTPIAGRGDQALDELVGMFVNTLVLRTDVRPELSFADLIAAVRDSDLRAFANAEVPFERLVEVLNPQRTTARHPLFQVMLDFQNTAQTSLALAGLEVSALDIESRTAKFDVQLTLTESTDSTGAPAGIAAVLEYATDLFDANTVATFAARLRRVLDAVGTDPQLRVGDIDLLSGPERVLVLDTWNATARDMDATATLVSLFEAQVARTPDAIALSFDGASLSYAEFASRVNRLARLLVSIGVCPGTAVALGMARSTELVVAMYAVLTAGGAYVPVDPDHPAERIEHVLRTVRPVCVLSRSGDGLDLTAADRPRAWAVLDVDLFDDSDYSDAPLTDADRLGALTPDNDAYVIFTSGSTGRPKGVAVSHAAIANRLVWMQDAYGLNRADTVLQKTPATFDVSVWEFFWPLQIGARLVVAEPDGHRDPRYLGQVIRHERVTVAHFVPSMLIAFVADAAAARCDSLRLVFCSGEALPPRPAHRLRELTGARLHNLYGPTEAAVDVTAHEVTDADIDTVPIGVPVANTQVYVLDGRLRPVPPGVPGELYLAGAQLARGYVARPELTSDRFVANPFDPSGARMYRTGDLVAWTSGGAIRYLGRTDFQVKVRGVRIEPGEIESVLIGMDSIAQAVVVVYAGTQLVGYLVAEPGATIGLDDVRSALGRRLPGYLVPSAFVVLDQFPLNASGKLDRKALPAPVFEATAFRAPATAVQEIVARVFGAVLGVERVGLDDDFFALGGNSLNATQVLARLGAALDAELPVRMLFEASSVAALAARAEAHEGAGGRTELAVRPRPERVPLSPAQQRMWFRNRFLSNAETGPGTAVDNIPVALRLTGELDVAALTTALTDVIDRHETLRTVYPDGPDGAEQVVLPRGSAVSVLRSDPVTESELAQQLAAFAATTFDVTSDMPLRAALFTIDGPNSVDHVLALVLHHISADGFSLGPLAGDLMTAYAARSAGTAPAWAALPVQYADYTLWQAENLGAAADPASRTHRQLAYWRQTLTGLPEQLELPTDRPRPIVSSYRGDTHRLRIDSDLHSELSELARKRDATLFATMHAALAVLLARLSSAEDIAIGTPVAGRGAAALDGLVGMFVNTLVLRTRIDTRARFETVLDTVRAQDIEALSHADIPFERLVELVAPTRAQNRHPLFQVAMTFQNFALPRLEMDGLLVRPVEFDAVTAKFDLQFTVLESNDAGGRADGMEIEITYATDLFDAATIEVLARRYTQVLAAIAADATVVVGDIQLLSAEEQHRALYEWAGTPGPRTAVTGTLADRFALAAAIDPAAVAVRAGDRSLTYTALDDRSNRLARRLIAAGVGPEALVAVALPRSVDLIVALLAVVKAGGGYLPIDPNYPADRIEYVLDDARPICAITSAATGLARGWFGGPVIEIDAADLESFDGAPVTDGDRRQPLDPAHTAYVIYTSGSTGRPKGVVIPHRNVLRLLDNTTGRFEFGPSDVWTLFHSYAFDFSVWELWGALLYGGRLVVVDYYTSRSPQQFLELLAVEGVTVLNQTPSAFYQLIAADNADRSRHELPLRYVIFGGEALEPQRLNGWFERRPNGPQLVNMYGITETTVHVSHRSIEAGIGSASVIGSAIPGLAVRVLDARLRPVPVGVPGEIYVSGGQLARAYLGRPALTASRFVADPYAGGGAPAYRSGDLARWTADGDLEYLGRVDQQVNLRGFRIELGEIEAALLDEAALTVSEVAVVVRADLVDEPRIVAYVVGAGLSDTAALRQALARRLPEHMVPAAIVMVDRIPLTVNGKLDRAALPAPVFEAKTYRKPATFAEEIVAGVFAEVLGFGAGTAEPRLVGADDDFFDLGGSSLLAAKAVARIGAALGRTVTVRALFEASRVADFAAMVTTGDGAAARPAPVAGARPDRLPLSPAQQRMWFLNRFDRSAIAYNIPLALRLSGVLDVAALQSAVGDVIGRHESLRTRYPELDGAPMQLIMPAAQAIPSLYPIEVTETELPDRIRELAATTFDVTVDVPIRMRLFAIGPDYVLAAVVHHIAADGSSIAPFIRDLMVAYTARCAGNAPGWAPLAVQYADYALWQRELLGAEDDSAALSAQQIAYWTETLTGLPDQLTLPADRPRPARQSLRGGKVEIGIDAQLHAALVALGRRAGATLFMVVHAAFAALLARLSGSSDIAVGTPIAGRGAAELDDVIGMFVNTLVLRTQVDGGATFEQLLGRARAADIAAFSHADVPFERLVEVLNPQRSTARHPLFQVGYSFQNHDRGSLRLPGLEVREVEFDSNVAQFDLHLFAVDSYAADGAPDGIDLAIGYATDLFETTSAQRFAAALHRVLESVATRPDILVGDLDLLGEVDRAQLLDEWNRTAHHVEPVTLADLIDAQAAATPHAVALIDATVAPETTLTYAEFDARVNRLARRLIAEGVGPESTVVLAMRRSVNLIAAMYAVVRAGGAYVPIDPDQPADRIAHIIDIAAPACILTTSADGMPIETRAAALEVDRIELAGFAATPIQNTDRIRPLRQAHSAYVIFTSGSTGLPKGVTVAHSAIVNQLAWLRDSFALGPQDCVLLKTPATFDLSVWEFWSPLVTGGRLVVTTAGTERDPDRVRALIERHGVTVLHAVPSLVGMLLAAAPDAPMPLSLRQVLAIGETLPPATAVEFRRRAARTRLFNLYGPTEAAVSITAFEVRADPSQVVPIGAPAWNSRVYVLDARLQPVPVGVPGELYLAGAQLARGYHRRPALTADRFVADPFAAAAEPMYRTGDIVRRRPDGALEYLERSDFQVKIGGFRIELGDVESALRRLSLVRAAVAVARDDERAGTRLIAYVAVPESDSAARADLAVELRAAVALELPAYMVPAAIVVLESLPLNANGKVDRAQLPEPVFTEVAYRVPSTEHEQLVATAFADVIGAATAGLDDHFFAMGGNSLMATRLAAQLGAALGVRVPVSSVFESPTVAALAAHIAELDGTEGRPALSRRCDPTPAALSLAQQRMWVVNRLAPDSSAYHIPAALRLTGVLDLDALTAAVLDVLSRHEALRTRYPDTERGPVQEVLDSTAVSIDLTPIPVRVSGLAAQLDEFVATGFDVTTAPPVRIALFETGRDEHVLVVVAHHISADGYSVAPMTRDLVRAYLSRAAGQRPDWAPLDIQYSDYSEWQREILGSDRDPASLLSRQLAYWTTELAGLPEVLALPTDRPRPARREMRGASVDFAVDAELTRRLNSVVREHGTTLFTLIHSAFAVLLAKLSGTSDIAIGAPVAGRGERELDDLIGMFVNTVVLRTEIDPRTGFADLLRQARDRDVAALSHADVPFERVVDALECTRSSTYTPLFQVLFTFQNMPAGRVTLPGLAVEALDLELAEAKFDLQLTGIEKFDAAGEPAGLQLRFGYATDIFDAATVELFADRLLRVFSTVVAAPSIAIRAIDIRTGAEQMRRAPRVAIEPVTVAELPALIEAAADIAPDIVAFEHGAHTVTYSQLAAKIAAVAKAMGAAAKPEALINVSLAGLVPGVLAALGGSGLAAVLRTLLTDAQAVVSNSGLEIDSEGNS